MLKGDIVVKLYPNVVTGGSNKAGLNEAFDKDGNAVDVDWDLIEAEYDAQEYARNRATAYPAIAEQLDEIYHNGIDSWKAVIKVTKDKYPKG